MSRPLVMPRLYVILDAGLARGPIQEIAARLMSAGVRLLQFRAKDMGAREMLALGKELTDAARQSGATLFLNDRPDVACLAGADGVHVGQEDLTVEQVRAVLGAGRWVGVSTHNQEQFQKAAAGSSDYIAIGPIFSTSSKANPDAVVGTEMIRKLRPLTKKPIVAIGGIRLNRATEVIEAGADSVAVISDILGREDPAEQAKRFIERLQNVKVIPND